MTPFFEHGHGTASKLGTLAALELAAPGRVNTLDAGLAGCIDAFLNAVQALDDVSGLLITSAHRDFCVGGDINAMYAQHDPEAMLREIRELNRVLRRLEQCGMPVVALIQGACLGGGYELAMACHHRIAVDSGTRIGLVELSLGLIPGAGGTQRLPRMIGISAALEHIIGAKGLKAPDALKAGLIDQLVPHRSDGLDAAAAWITQHPDATQPWDAPGFRAPGPRPGTAPFVQLFMGASAKVEARNHGAFKAPEVLLSVVHEGAMVGLDPALEIEARAFSALATSGQVKDVIRTLWFSRRAAQAHTGLPSHKGDARFERVAILGAGMMGSGLALLAAQSGHDVVLQDVSQRALDGAVRTIDRELSRRRALDESARARVRDRIHLTLDPDEVAGADLVIEAVVEDMQVKHEVTERIAPGIAADAIWASNTSALPIAELAAPFPDPARFLGLHFFSPVTRMELVEVVQGPRTSPDTVAKALAFCRALGKTPILVNDGYGFFTTRVFAAYILEAVALLIDGHPPQVIEAAAQQLGMAAPPLMVFDEVSLVLGRHVCDDTLAYTGRSIPGVAAVLDAMIDQHKRPGRASGAGFYDYEEGRRAGLWRGLSTFAQHGTRVDLEAAKERLLLAQVNETARAFDDGVLRGPADADVAAVLGIGFAPNLGGPCAAADRIGPAQVVLRLNTLAEQVGERFAPADALRAHAAAGSRFYEP